MELYPIIADIEDCGIIEDDEIKMTDFNWNNNNQQGNPGINAFKVNSVEYRHNTNFNKFDSNGNWWTLIKEDVISESPDTVKVYEIDENPGIPRVFLGVPCMSNHLFKFFFIFAESFRQKMFFFAKPSLNHQV